jgi:cobalt-zinc-cadmium efflux system outer membrane protein
MKTKFSIHIIFICLLTISIGLPAQEQETLTLKDCISICLQENSLLLSYGHQYNATKARVTQAKSFPQPEVSLDYDLQPKAFDFKHSGEQYIGLGYLLEFPGRRFLRGKISEKESEAFGCEVESVKLDVIFQVKKAFYELLLAQKNKSFAKENVTLAKDFLAKAKEKYEAGDVAKMEVMKARVEAARVGNQETAAQREVALSKARLNFLLSREKHQSLMIRGTLKADSSQLDLDHLVKCSLERRPEIKKAILNLEAGKLFRKQAFLSYLPDFSLGVSKHKVAGELDTWDVTLGFEVPLLFWQKRAQVREAQFNILAQEEEFKYVELSVSLEVENAYQNARSYKNQIDFFEKEVLKEAEEVYQMAMASYKEGKIGSLGLNESRRTLIDLKEAYAEVLFNYQLALAEVEKCTGITLK